MPVAYGRALRSLSSFHHRRYPLQPELPCEALQCATDTLLGICIDSGCSCYHPAALRRGTLAKAPAATWNATSWEPISVGEVPPSELKSASIGSIYVLGGRRQDSFPAPVCFTNHASAGPQKPVRDRQYCIMQVTPDGALRATSTSTWSRPCRCHSVVSPASCNETLRRLYAWRP